MRGHLGNEGSGMGEKLCFMEFFSAAFGLLLCMSCIQRDLFKCPKDGK